MCLLAGERLPSADRYIDKQRIDFDAVTDPPGRLRRHQGGAATQKWLVDGLPRTTVIEHGPAHTLNRLLGRMRGLSVLSPRGDIPQRRLLAIAGPVALFANGVPAGFMLPMIVALTHNQSLLGPDNFGSDRKAHFDQAVGDRAGMQRPVPDIGNVAREQRPSGGPIRPLIVSDIAA